MELWKWVTFESWEFTVPGQLHLRRKCLVKKKKNPIPELRLILVGIKNQIFGIMFMLECSDIGVSCRLWKIILNISQRSQILLNFFVKQYNLWLNSMCLKSQKDWDSNFPSTVWFWNSYFLWDSLSLFLK